MANDTEIEIDLVATGVDETVADIRKVSDELAKLHKAMVGSGSSGSVSNSPAFNPNKQISFAAGGGNASAQVRSLSLTVRSISIHATSVTVQASQSGSGGNNPGSDSGLSGLGELASVIYTAKMLVDGFLDLSRAAIAATTALTNIALTSGGSQTESTRLSVMGSILGVDMGQMARQMSSEIAGGGAATGFASSRLSIHDPGLFGNVDKATNLLEAIKRLNEMSLQQAELTARAIPALEPLLKMRLLSNEQKQGIDFSILTRGAVMTPKVQKDMANFQASVANASVALENLFTALIDKGLPLLTDTINNFAMGANIAALALSSFPDFAKALMDVMAGNNVDAAIDIANGTARVLSAQAKQTAQEQRLTDATSRLAGSMEYAVHNGVFGGGERARGAIPSKWQGINADRYVGEAAKLGAFNL